MGVFEELSGDCGGCCGIGRVYVKDLDSSNPSWHDCKLKLSEICNAELVPDDLRVGDEDARCSWLRSQIIGSERELSKPFGKRHLTYADYTASGRCLRHVENFINNHVMPCYGNTHAEDSYVGDTTSYLVNESARYIKECMGASEEDALLFCGSGCTAAVKRLQEVMGLIVPSMLRSRVLETMEEHERWVVFIGPFEHHSNLLSWRHSLAEVVEVPVNEEGLMDMVYLEKALKDPKYDKRRKMGSFSACSNVTGILVDTKSIAQLLHEHGAIACFDFASCGPYVEIKMREDGYDAIVLSPHKFVGGPGTPGLLLMNKKIYMLHDYPPSIAGGGAVDFVNGYTEKDTLYLKDIEAREDAGTPPILQKIKAALAFWVKEEMGYKLIESREEYFIKTALKRLSLHPNMILLGNTDTKRAAILSFLISTPSNPRQIIQGRLIVKMLDDIFGIQSRGGCACAGPYGHSLLGIDHKTSRKLREAILKGYGGLRPGWARLNFAYFMSTEEFEFILSAIEFIADFGERLIPLYDLNWRSGNWTFKSEMTSDLTTLLLNPQFQQLEQETSLPIKYTQYLEFAKELALALPSHPPQRPIPNYIDHDLVDFKI